MRLQAPADPKPAILEMLADLQRLAAGARGHLEASRDEDFIDAIDDCREVLIVGLGPDREDWPRMWQVIYDLIDGAGEAWNIDALAAAISEAVQGIKAVQ